MASGCSEPIKRRSKLPACEKKSFNFRHADLHRLLHEQIQVLSFRNCLAKRNPATQWRHFGFVQFPKTQFVAGKIDNLRCDLASAAVKENGAISALHPQNVTGMMSLRAAQTQRVWIPVFR